MADFTGDLVLVEFDSPYPYLGRTYAPGERESVPDYSVPAIVDASPPYGRVVDLEAEDSGSTDPEPDPPSGTPDEGPADTEVELDATEAAAELALDQDPPYDLKQHAGQGSGRNGRIQKPDVKRWLGIE